MRSLPWPALAGPALALALFLAAVGQDAPAAVSQRPPAGTPDPKQMVLRPADFRGGAKVTKQGYYRDTEFPSVISYLRTFDEATVGSTDLTGVESHAEIGTSAQSTARFLQGIKRLYGTKQFRTLLKKQFQEEFGDLLGLVSNPQVGRPRRVGLGPGAFDLLITFRVLSLRTDVHLTVFRVERVLGALFTAGTPGQRVPLSVVTRLGKIMSGRMVVELAPKNTVAPTVSGTPQVGQTLTATTGTWAGSPSSFTYQWQRCDAAGANCADIPGATSQSYLLTDSDAGSTIRVAVTARGATGSATAESAPTAVVSPLSAPTNTSPPTISGTPQVGQLLTAGTGSWTGNPTSFSFQWQRCDSAGANCADIAGATGGTYVAAAADVGSTIRVAVTAHNAAGAATAFSAPTSIVA
jgi:hypothetical protein